MRVKSLAAAVLVAIVSAGVSSAQVPTGMISGRVVDSSGGVLPGVTVTATSPSLQGPRVVVTSENGDYVLPLLTPGPYTVSFELSGFQTATQKADVASTETIPLDVTLGVGGVTEQVTVTGQAHPFL